MEDNELKKIYIYRLKNSFLTLNNLQPLKTVEAQNQIGNKNLYNFIIQYTIYIYLTLSD
jgi:hypothetical protein